MVQPEIAHLIARERIIRNRGQMSLKNYFKILHSLLWLKCSTKHWMYEGKQLAEWCEGWYYFSNSSDYSVFLPHSGFTQFH